MDELGRVVGEAPPDKFQARIGVALALKEISPELSEEDVEPLISLYIPDALCDPHQEVWMQSENIRFFGIESFFSYFLRYWMIQRH